jgi:basic membrane protein A
MTQRRTAHHGKRTLFLVSVALVAALTVVAGSSGNTGSKQAVSSLKVAFLYPSPANDGGWSMSHDQARKALEKAFPGKVTTVFKENVPESPAAGQVIDSLLQDGADVIFAASYGYHTYMVNAAKANPDKHFFQLQSNELGPNLSQYNGALEEPAYVAGMIAGAAAKNGKIGMTAEFPVPSVTTYVNAFALGAKAINPSATVRVIWTNSWYDPPKEAVAARSLISSGVSLIAQNENSSATAKQAALAKLPYVGSFWRMGNIAPKYYVTSPIFTWAPFYISQVRSIFNGTFKSKAHYLRMKDRGVGLDRFGAQYESVSSADRAKISDIQKKLQKGTFDVYSGPITDTKGKLRVKAGQKLPMAGRFSMNWFVSNVLTNK